MISIWIVIKLLKKIALYFLQILQNQRQIPKIYSQFIPAKIIHYIMMIPVLTWCQIWLHFDLTQYYNQSKK